MANQGDKHGNWRGGISEGWYRRVMANAKIPSICVDCGKVDKLHIHHKNKDHQDNRVDNLEFVCPKCHHKRHPTICSEERKELLKETMKGENNPNYGNRWTEEQKTEMSEKKKGQTPWNKGKKTGYNVKQAEKMLGKHLSPETQFKKGMIPWFKKRGFNSVKEAAKNR